MNDDRPTPCDFCGAPLGTTAFRDVVMVNVERGFFRSPADESERLHLLFCDEEHFRQFVSERPRPFITPEPDEDAYFPDEDEPGFRYGGLIAVGILVALAIVGLVSLVRLLF